MFRSNAKCVSFRHARRYSQMVEKCPFSAPCRSFVHSDMPSRNEPERLGKAHITSRVALNERKLQFRMCRIVMLSKNGRRMRRIWRGGPRSKDTRWQDNCHKLGNDCMKSSLAEERSSRASTSVVVSDLGAVGRAAVMRAKRRVPTRRGEIQRRCCARARHARQVKAHAQRVSCHSRPTSQSNWSASCSDTASMMDSQSSMGIRQYDGHSARLLF